MLRIGGGICDTGVCTGICDTDVTSIACALHLPCVTPSLVLDCWTIYSATSLLTNEVWVCDTVSHLTQTFFTTHSVQYTQYTLSVHILSSLHSVLMLHSCS